MGAEPGRRFLKQPAAKLELVIVVFFDVCCANSSLLVRCQVPTTSYNTGKTITTDKYWT